MLFNINDCVKVRLTDHGRSILAREGLLRPREGWVKFQL